MSTRALRPTIFASTISIVLGGAAVAQAQIRVSPPPAPAFSNGAASSAALASAIDDCTLAISDGDVLLRKGWERVDGVANPNPRTIRSIEAFERDELILQLREFETTMSCTLFAAAPPAEDQQRYLAEIASSLHMNWYLGDASTFGSEAIGRLLGQSHNVLVQRRMFDDTPILVLTTIPRA